MSAPRRSGAALLLAGALAAGGCGSGQTASVRIPAHHPRSTGSGVATPDGVAAAPVAGGGQASVTPAQVPAATPVAPAATTPVTTPTAATGGAPATPAADNGGVAPTTPAATASPVAPDAAVSTRPGGPGGASDPAAAGTAPQAKASASNDRLDPTVATGPDWQAATAPVRANTVNAWLTANPAQCDGNQPDQISASLTEDYGNYIPLTSTVDAGLRQVCSQLP